MSIASFVLDSRAASGEVPSPTSDFWYTDDPITGTASGIRVTPESAMRASAVFACVRLIAAGVAMLPLLMYQRAAPGSPDRDRVPNHPLQELFTFDPNPRQTGFEWRQTMTTHLALRGNAYSEMIEGPRGFVDSLEPLHPDLVRPKMLKNRKIVYDYWDPALSRTRRLAQEEVFHLRDISVDGILGLSRIAMHREGIGLALAVEQFGTRYFGSGSRPGGVLQSDKKLGPDARDRIKESWNSAHQGPWNAHKVAVLEQGLKWNQVGISPNDSQFLETRRFQVADIARMFGVPLHMIQETEKTTSWGSGIEQMSLGFVTYSLGPWLLLWEQSITKQLILAAARGIYFAEHLVDGLVRGDIKTRYQTYEIALENGVMNPDEVRRKENMKPREDGRGSEYRDPTTSSRPSRRERDGGNGANTVLPETDDQKEIAA